MLEILPSVFEGYQKTCSITNIQDGCVTFARDLKYLEHVFSKGKTDAWIIIPEYASFPFNPESKELKYFKCKYPDYLFTLFHNSLYKDKGYKMVTIGNDCNLHETVVMGVEGLKVVHGPNGKRINFVHTGKCVIEDNVEIGPYSIIHRGSMDDTIVGKGCKFSGYTNIGHNCIIGESTVMAAGVIINGGARIGNNCWLGSGSIVKNYVNVCDNVVLGLGAVVVKDITESGIYVGTPAKYLKPITEGWNF